MRLGRVTLAPGAGLPPAAEPDPALRHVDACELARAPAAFCPNNPTVPCTPMREGGRLVLVKAGAEPLVLLVLTLEPAGEERTPAAATPAP